jgi:hypothetical protein
VKKLRVVAGVRIEQTALDEVKDKIVPVSGRASIFRQENIPS